MGAYVVASVIFLVAVAYAAGTVRLAVRARRAELAARREHAALMREAGMYSRRY